MRKNWIGRDWDLGVAGMMAGCMGQHTIHARAWAPTESEARVLAEGGLNDQANALNAESTSGGYEMVGSPHFSTKVVEHGDGADVYEVTGSATVKPVK